jgi:hypothetical protein
MKMLGSGDGDESEKES